LQKVFEIVSGKSLTQFFTQWLYTPENPQLEITWKYIEKGKQIAVKVKQLQKNIFDIPLQMAISAGPGTGKPQIKTIQISKMIETFNIPVRQKTYLSANSLDPFTSLLYEVSVKEEK
jgi:aminopeptidase N